MRNSGMCALPSCLVRHISNKILEEFSKSCHASEEFSNVAEELANCMCLLQTPLITSHVFVYHALLNSEEHLFVVSNLLVDSCTITLKFQHNLDLQEDLLSQL